MSDIQRDREERQHVIEVLKSWDGYFIGYTSDEVQEALRYAIASIKTDLKYDLLYEETSGQADKPTTKNDLAVDCISRVQAQTEIEMNASRYTIAKERGGMGQVEWSDQLIEVSDAVDIIRKLPTVTPQPRKGHWISHREHCKMNNLLPSGLGSYFWCSECDCGIDSKNFSRVNYNFCPHCGADMREVEK